METLSKARIKYIQSLQHKKFRLKYDKFIVEGLKITREILIEKTVKVETVYLSNPDYRELLAEVVDESSISSISPREMHQLSQMTTPPGVLAVCTVPEPSLVPTSMQHLHAFYLDAIRDPGNLGTILRIADWFGLDYVLLSPDCVDIYNHKVLQASMGSAFRVRTCTLEIHDLLTLDGLQLFVCDTGGTSINSMPPPASGVIVLGNESLGVSGALMHQVGALLAIPGDRSLGAESLNVASAAAVMAAWWVNRSSD